jgi:hypothetical protein
VRVISIDPGEMTGYVYATIIDGALTYYPFQMVDDVDQLWDRLLAFNPVHIVMEDFEFRRGKQASKGGLNLFPVQLIGVARLWVTQHPGRNIHLQKPSVGLGGYYSLNVLKQIGLYKRGVPHGMSALQHLMQWAMFRAGNQFIGKQSADEFATMADRLEWWRDE